MGYDENRDPAKEDKFSSWVPAKGKSKGWWSYKFPKFKKAKKNPRVMVRARVKEVLENLQKYLPKEVEIQEWKYRDYPYRIVILQKWWQNAIAKIAEDIEYTNFKDRVKEKQGGPRASLYMGVWSAMSGAEHKLKPAKWEGKTSGKNGLITWGDYDEQFGFGEASDIGTHCKHNKTWKEPCDACEQESFDGGTALVKLDPATAQAKADNLTIVDPEEAVIDWLDPEDIEWLDGCSAEELEDLGVTEAQLDDLREQLEGLDPLKVLQDPFGVAENIAPPVSDGPLEVSSGDGRPTLKVKFRKASKPPQAPNGKAKAATK